MTIKQRKPRVVVHFVEVYKPCFPEKGTKLRVHRFRHMPINNDFLSPDCVTVLQVDGAVDSKEATALCVQAMADCLGSGHYITFRNQKKVTVYL